MPADISFGQFVKKHRLAIGLTQVELSGRVGCATITLRRIEADSLRPSVQIAERLAMALDIPLEERTNFVRLARTALLGTPEPPAVPAPTPEPEEIGGEDLTGRAVRGYELGERIGSGGFGAVYRAVQPGVEREVALKIILPQYANHPDFVRRFEAEAHLVARLEHPYIVPLYDFWREPNAAYLVMRLLRGGSLRHLLENGPLPLDFFWQVLNQIGRGLHAAHRFGIIHRDLKPDNILLDEDKNAYLADFGIAKNLGNPDPRTMTSAGDLIGSPAYMSPEQIRSEAVRPQADIYCLGIMLFEMLTGVLPFPGPTPVDQIMHHLNQPLPSLQELVPDLPSQLGAIIQKATEKDPQARYQSIPELLEAVRISFSQRVEGQVWEVAGLPDLQVVDPAVIDNPFKGLRAFTEADAEHFYGRNALVQSLLGRIGQENDTSRFLAVVGPSGSGKSSVVKAGFVPAVRRGALPGSEHWFIVDFMPGRHPFEELEAALLRVAVNPPKSLLQQLQEGERGLIRAVKRILPADEHVELLMVIDQFEEIFSAVDDERLRTKFLDSIVTAVLEPRSRIRIVITMRADFTDRPLGYVDFGELVRQQTEFVLPLTPDELEQAITGPVRGSGLVMEPALLARMMRELGDQPGTLPLLQYALTELFERRDGLRLTMEAYQEIGGVLGALGQRAEEIFSGFDETRKQATQQLFLRLVTLGEGVEDTRRRVLLEEVISLQEDPGFRSDPGGGDGEIKRVLDQYVSARLLTFDHDPATRLPTVEVAHEAILREWERLRTWLNEGREDIRLQRQLARAAGEWEDAERDPSFLLRGARLAQIETWREETDIALSPVERAFLEAGVRARKLEEEEEAAQRAREAALQKRSQRFLQALVGVFLVAAVVSVWLAIRASQAEGEARRQAGILLGSQAENEVDKGFADLGTLLALEALENYPYTPQAEFALGQAIVANRGLQVYDGHANAATGAAWSKDGSLIATTSTDNSVHIWGAETGQLQKIIDLPQGITGNFFDWGLAVAWSPDSRFLATITGDRYVLGSQDYDLIIWNAESGEKASQIELNNQTPPDAGDVSSSFFHYTTAAALDFSKDGRLATIGGDNSALIWGPQLQEPELVLDGHEGGVNGISWSPDGSHLATSSEDGSIIIWDGISGQPIRRVFLEIGPVNQVAWSPMGDLMAAGGDNGSTVLFDTTTGESRLAFMPVAEESTLTGDDRIVYSVAWSPGGDLLATGTGDGGVRLWDTETGEFIAAMFGHTDFVTFLAWSPVDNRLISTGADGQARIWDASHNRMEFRLDGSAVYASWSPDGSRLMFGGAWEGGGKGISVWDTENWEQVFETFVDKDERWLWMGMGHSPDGKHLITRGMLEWPMTTDANKYYILDSATGEIVRKLETGADVIVLNPGWSPDGKLVAGGDWEGKIYFWDVKSGEIIRSMQCLTWGHKINWSPDGSKIALFCLDIEQRTEQIQVLDARTFEQLIVIETSTDSDPFWWYDWSPDSQYIAVGGGNDEVGVLSNPVMIYDADSGEKILSIDRHNGQVSGIDWSPNGKRVVSSSTDGTTRVWNALTGDELLRLATPNNWEGTPFWSPDGRFLAVSVYDFDGEPNNSGVWRVWQTTEDLIAYAKDCCVFRELTSEERQQFGLPPPEETGFNPARLLGLSSASIVLTGAVLYLRWHQK